MKTLSIILSSLLTFGFLQAQTWNWENAPKAGQNVLIHVNDVSSDNGPLHMVYYCFDGTELIAGDVGMLPNNKKGQVQAAVAIHDHVSWIRVVIKDKYYDKILAADQQPVFNEKALPKAGLIEQAIASSIYARPLGIEANDAEVTGMFREAIQAYPKWLDDPEVFRSYYIMAKRISSTEDLDALKKYMTEVSEKSNDATENLLVQTVRAAKDMSDSTLHMALRKKLDKKYPKSILAQEEMLNDFTKAETIEEKIKIREQFRSQFPVTKENKRMTDQMTSSLAQQYATKEDWTKVKYYVDQIIDPMTRARVCNDYAWTLSGESIESDAPHLDVAAELSSTSLNLLTSDNPIPTSVTKSEWASSLESSKAMYGDTYALILFKQGKVNEAIDHQLFSVRQYEYSEVEMNERFAIYLEKAGRTKELTAFMDQIFVIGKASEKVKELHKNYWTKSATQDQVYAQYLMQIETRAKELRQEKLRKMWQEDNAAAFTLKDLSGHEVSLEDYKGKTVILDFWATWCGPCKASFPGMKQAVEHYASDENVVFLFIDTWENGENKEKKVGDFIKNNNYPFHVLMDNDFKVVGDYKVDGIPTKFIIGPDQKIRFTSVGFGGNNEELFEELKFMIEMVKETAIPEKS